MLLRLRLGATEEEIIDAATATYVGRFVRSLPEGYDTVLAEEAENVSAGERQLITIARAFLARPSVLILDEATSSVDTRTEALVQEAVAALRGDRAPALHDPRRRPDPGDGRLADRRTGEPWGIAVCRRRLHRAVQRAVCASGR
ncbi:hypothetical protein GCM10017711_28120 [Paeniglutamicibacter sulfureus]